VKTSIFTVSFVLMTVMKATQASLFDLLLDDTHCIIFQHATAMQATIPNDIMITERP
jgi:hypothetical protein